MAMQHNDGDPSSAQQMTMVSGLRDGRYMVPGAGSAAGLESASEGNLAEPTSTSATAGDRDAAGAAGLGSAAVATARASVMSGTARLFASSGAGGAVPASSSALSALTGSLGSMSLSAISAGSAPAAATDAASSVPAARVMGVAPPPPPSHLPVAAEGMAAVPAAPATASPRPSPEEMVATVRGLVDPLTKEQLMDMLVGVSLRCPGAFEYVRLVAAADPSHRKLFVRGLAWETTDEELHAVFSEHGEIEEAVVITEKNTGKSRGYGFVTFRTMDAAERALVTPTKIINGRPTVCNLASLGASNNVNRTIAAATVSAASALVASTGDSTALRKLFIRGLSWTTTTETLMAVFGQYGEIEEGTVAYDRSTGKSRGFGFVTFKHVDGATRALREPTKIIDGRTTRCNLAIQGALNKQGKLGRTGSSSSVSSDSSHGHMGHGGHGHMHRDTAGDARHHHGGHHHGGHQHHHHGGMHARSGHHGHARAAPVYRSDTRGFARAAPAPGMMMDPRMQYVPAPGMHERVVRMAPGAVPVHTPPGRGGGLHGGYDDGSGGGYMAGGYAPAADRGYMGAPPPGVPMHGVPHGAPHAAPAGYPMEDTYPAVSAAPGFGAPHLAGLSTLGGSSSSLPSRHGSMRSIPSMGSVISLGSSSVRSGGFPQHAAGLMASDSSGWSSADLQYAEFNS